MTRKIFLDIKIGDIEAHEDALGRYNKAKEWVKQWSSTYGLSSDDLDKLTPDDKETVTDILSTNPTAINEKWLTVAPKPLKGGHLVIELNDKECPKTCENFASLCKGGKVGKSSKKPLFYKNTVMFRLVHDFIVQGGDVTRGDGSGGDSIYNGKFNDEKPGLAKKFNEKGVVAMANSGKNSNTSQFFITLNGHHPQFEKINGKYVIFGKVIEGLEVLDDINQVPEIKEQPQKTITIVNCGEC
ncbi:cyclophilin-like domain-containing protein [Cokeromyces recurvatus]|uniref:cyclophilin-like domain-containing protein n=1 Tax=Cokeromyces recurvatus TaxID=90255 RepID=UPI0022209D74|nr:cyclophilin-like domain-containing protein [Cokeromyces recurvatus]KAI7904524.1 cyclophilin-like domain-containing protein [Cokeromyces recurvatus]